MIQKNRRQNNSGFTMTETIVTVSIVAVAFLVLCATFQLFVIQSAQSRNYMFAEMLSNSLIEEISAHEYGTPQPDNWERDYYLLTIINGMRGRHVFNRSVVFANGSLVGKSSEIFDLATIRIRWNDRAGGDGRGEKVLVRKMWFRREL